jgi:hypothetical protein
MSALLNATIGAPGTFTGPLFQLREIPGQPMLPAQVLVQETFTYGSGGASVDAFLQTSYDAGGTWNDVIHFAQLLLASKRVLWGLASTPPAAAVDVSAGDDGTILANTLVPGVFGSWWRVKYIVAGTYAGGTILRLDALANVQFVPAGIGA